ncbi:MAG: hypothetical protein FT726_19030 [Pantoea sp. Morm]|uniref:hypothetical protein n=1 Tax=Pantoea TaxID=53335 RepID=UPI001D330A03|nr:hypothetical protein [uncultured Pantoea sp.]MBK4771722.1 hypothetical protein [Pantoea sp. Morm]
MRLTSLLPAAFLAQLQLSKQKIGAKHQNQHKELNNGVSKAYCSHQSQPYSGLALQVGLSLYFRFYLIKIKYDELFCRENCVKFNPEFG